MIKWESEPDDRLVCYCIKVNKQTIVNSIKSGCGSMGKIKEDTKACTGGDCKKLNPTGKCCSKDILELIRIFSNSADLSESKCSCCK